MSSVAIGDTGTASGDYAVAVGSRATASAAGAVAMGKIASATGVNAIAIGTGATATGSVAVGAGAFASNGGAAFGDGASAGRRARSRSARARSPAPPNTVSFGSPGAERRLTNIAPGIGPTDAATYGQVTDMNREARSGTALALASSSLRYDDRPGKFRFRAGSDISRARAASRPGWAMQSPTRCASTPPFQARRRWAITAHRSAPRGRSINKQNTGPRSES